MRDAVELNGGQMTEEAYLNAVLELIESEGGTTSITSLKSNAFNSKRMADAGITRLTIGKDKYVWTIAMVESMLAGNGTSMNTSTSMPSDNVSAPVMTTDDGTYYGIRRRQSEEYPEMAQAYIRNPQDLHYVESEKNEMRLLSIAFKSGMNVSLNGPKGCGKTHLANILKQRINSLFIDASDFNNNSLKNLESKECLIIDNYNNNIEEKLLYSALNQSNQSNQYVVINSLFSIKTSKINLNDLSSRFESFIDLGIKLPTDDLLRVILTKSFSDEQIKVNVKILEYILKNVDRSYEKIFEFIKDIDAESLSTGKAININLIKKILNK